LGLLPLKLLLFSTRMFGRNKDGFIPEFLSLARFRLFGFTSPFLRSGRFLLLEKPAPPPPPGVGSGQFFFSFPDMVHWFVASRSPWFSFYCYEEFQQR